MAKKKAKAAPAKKVTKRKPAATKKRGNTNAASVRNELTALQRDQNVTRLYLEGHATSVIAERLGIAPREVRSSIQRTRKQWREEKIEDYSEAAAKIEHTASYIMSLALDAYRRSCDTEHEVTRQTMSDDGNSSTTETKRKPAGDARFLSLAERCNYQIGQVHGVFDRDARSNSATTDQKAALIEVVIQSPAELKHLQTLDYRDLEKVAVERSETIEGKVIR